MRVHFHLYRPLARLQALLESFKTTLNSVEPVHFAIIVVVEIGEFQSLGLGTGGVPEEKPSKHRRGLLRDPLP